MHLAMHGFSPGTGQYCILCDCVCAPAVDVCWVYTGSAWRVAAGSTPAGEAEDAAEAEDKYIASDLSDSYLDDSDDSLA